MICPVSRSKALTRSSWATINAFSSGVLTLFDKPAKVLKTSKAGTTPEKTPEKIGQMRAVLGPVLLNNPRTGSTETRPASSLVLFDERGAVLWRAP
jgi:hypothetical protein